ncbi:class A beta-lactamase [Paucibacter sp. KBW04]|uniref:class A beta-lactamase n=1 Tax=Paucibacter sp. KBW04 TaxID=2153361 RepID=UPI000F582E8E|nr:class A beta-lactamase [Paucibacter sp. KBW04]RQO61981.1 class A beta-lactamase [Paucibacter sp. KBW04]
MIDLLNGADVKRRALLITGLGLAAGLHAAEPELLARIEALQKRSGGRIGLFALNSGSRAQIAFNADQRFAFCSSFKLLLAAAVLARVDAGQLSLDKPIRFGSNDIVAHAPITSARLVNGRGVMSVGELCEAIVTVSDNPAANLLFPLVGGPPGLTRFLRELGDQHTRSDRIELALNTNLVGDERDTTTPAAFVASMEALLLGNRLSEEAVHLLLGWMVGSTTGLQRLRAGLPEGWRAGDKTGSGANGAVNDVAIFWKPEQAPLLMAVFMTGSEQSVDELNAIHAELAGLVVKALG